MDSPSLLVGHNYCMARDECVYLTIKSTRRLSYSVPLVVNAVHRTACNLQVYGLCATTQLSCVDKTLFLGEASLTGQDGRRRFTETSPKQRG